MDVNIVYMNTTYHNPEVMIVDGRYGSGYIYSLTNLDTMKPIHIDFPAMREWVEKGCLKIVSVDNHHHLVLPRAIPWRLIVEWCKCGANISYWDN